MGRSDGAAHNRAVDSLPRQTRCARVSAVAAVAVVTSLALLTSLLASLPARAGDDDARDHERARAAVQAGQVLPLATLLQRLQRSHPGQVLQVELEHDDGRWVYELKLLQPGGRLLKLELDAATGAVLKSRERAAPRSPGASPKAP